MRLRLASKLLCFTNKNSWDTNLWYYIKYWTIHIIAAYNLSHGIQLLIILLQKIYTLYIILFIPDLNYKNTLNSSSYGLVTMKSLYNQLKGLFLLPKTANLNPGSCDLWSTHLP